MAYQYWDYGNSTSSYWPSNSTSTTTITSPWGDGAHYYWVSPASTTSTYVPYAPSRVVWIEKRVLVTHPPHWTQADAADFTRLVNDETRTGWKIEMVISGDIKITDPSIDVRSMRDFVLLLKQYATPDDKAQIDKFFAAHAVEPPQP